LDKARKHKKRQLEDTLKMVVKKRKEYDEKKKEQGEATTSVMFSHLPPQRRLTGEEDLKPEDSVYYHPTLNPTGAPPPGKPPMYNSSIGISFVNAASYKSKQSFPYFLLLIVKRFFFLTFFRTCYLLRWCFI
jgi:hypothetical protein